MVFLPIAISINIDCEYFHLVAASSRERTIFLCGAL